MTDNEDTSYVPKSPDFSSFFSQPPPPPSFPLLDDQTQTAPRPQHLQPPPPPGGFYHQVPASYAHAPPTPPAPHVQHHHQSPPQYQQPHPGPALHNFSSISPQQQGAGPPYGHGLYDLTSTRQQQKPVQQYASQGTYGTPQQLGYQAPAYPQTYQDTQIPVAQFPPSPHAYSAPPISGTAPAPVPLAQSTLPHQHPPPSGTMPPRRATQQAPPPPVIEPSPVRTKFPTARIKRIMQADEEVGKVAQQTPIAVGKALELFMISMVSKSADVAKEKGQKRVTAGMLKQVVETDDQFDFLREIVSKVEISEEKTKAARVKADTDSDDEAPEPKRRVRGGRKKKSV